MQNVKTEVKGTTLTITIDLGKSAVEAAKPSASGKTKLLATTGGAMQLPAIPGTTSASLALNLMVK